MTPTGPTADAGWEIGVSRTLPVPPDQVWDFVAGDDGVALWLGHVSLPTAKGASYETAEGTRGEIRGYRPHDRIRLTCRPRGWDHDTTLQIAVTPARTGSGAVLRFHQERLADAAERARQRAHWQEVLDTLTPHLVPAA